MADDRLGGLLQGLDVAVTPDPAFVESLFERLAPRALAAGRRDRTWHGRIVVAVRSWPSFSARLAPASIRTIVLAAMLLALLLALAAIVGGRAPDPNRLVIGSEGVYRAAPAFDMTVGYSDGSVRRFRYDGDSTMRLDVVVGAYRLRPEGTYFLADVSRGRVIEWDPAGGTATVSAIPPGTRALGPLDLRWGADLQVTTRFASSCLDWEYVELADVIGRPAHHVRCTSGRHEEYWVDRASGFVLRSTDVPTDEDDVWLTGEVQRLELNAVLDPAAFAMADDDPRSGASMPGGDAPFESGVRVVTNRFSPAFAAMPGDGWRSWGTDADIVGFVRGPDWNGTEGAAVFVIRLTVVADVASGRDRPLVPGPQAVLDWLRNHPYFDVGPVVEARIGSLDAVSVAFREVRPDDFETTCPVPPAGAPVPSCWNWFAAGGGHMFYGDGKEDARATVVDVKGTTITVLTWASGPDLADHLTAVEDLLGTIEFLD